MSREPFDAFVPLESVDPLKIAEGYYLQPAGQVAAKPYKLLVKALSRSAKVAVAKYVCSGWERLGLLRVHDDVLLHAMRWPDEIRAPTEGSTWPAADSLHQLTKPTSCRMPQAVRGLRPPSRTVMPSAGPAAA
ncbi:hypothetical protein EASAB2608_01006 [Streptomyces sp. EAS-AB2608]|nr:hypothetical protein EASAB2608_01006 [Streptomyces sp. EAS-AB2608]